MKSRIAQKESPIAYDKLAKRIDSFVPDSAYLKRARYADRIAQLVEKNNKPTR